MCNAPRLGQTVLSKLAAGPVAKPSWRSSSEISQWYTHSFVGWHVARDYTWQQKVTRRAIQHIHYPKAKTSAGIRSARSSVIHYPSLPIHNGIPWVMNRWSSRLLDSNLRLVQLAKGTGILKVIAVLVGGSRSFTKLSYIVQRKNLDYRNQQIEA